MSQSPYRVGMFVIKSLSAISTLALIQSQSPYRVGMFVIRNFMGR